MKKKYILTATALLFSISLFAQPSGYHRIYNTYRGEEGIVSIRVPGFLMRFAGMCADLDRQERHLLRSLRSVHVLTVEDSHLYPGLNFAEEMKTDRMRGDYQLLLELHDGDEDVIIAAREKRGRITDLLVVVGGEENTLVHVRGRMDCDLLEELGEVSGIKELKVTAKLDSKEI